MERKSLEENWGRIIGATSWFRGRMHKKLWKHRAKGDWMTVPEIGGIMWYYNRINDERAELCAELVKDDIDWDAVIDECADVANFCLMIADHARVAKRRESVVT